MCMGGAPKTGPTPEQQESSRINQEMWDYYQTNYRPMVERYTQDALNPVTQELESKQIAGQVNADVMKQAKPVSPGNAIANQKHMMNIADVNAIGQTEGQMAAKNRQIGKQENVVDIGRRQVTKAMAGLDELGRDSAVVAARYNQTKQNESATLANNIGSLVGSVAGAAAGGMSAAKGPSRSGKGALIYGSPEYEELARKWGY